MEKLESYFLISLLNSLQLRTLIKECVNSSILYIKFFFID